MAADIPSALTSGTVTIAAGTASDLGALVAAQIDPNAAQVGSLVSIQADSTNTSPILFGMSAKVGTGNPAQYGFSLAAGADRQFGSGLNPNIQYGRWYVYSSASALLHIEIFP